MKNPKYIALGILVGFLVPYIVALYQAQTLPNSEEKENDDR